MKATRDKYGENEHSILYAETGGRCPLCGLSILFKKKGSTKISKGYEVAHIYPLNPTAHQTSVLAGYAIPDDLNSLENVIALCPTCHRRYDKDFKIEEFLKLRAIKDGYLSYEKSKQTASEQAIQEEICEILDAISSFDESGFDSPQTKFETSTIEKKLKNGMSPLQKQEIRGNVVTFYVRIRDHLKRMEVNDQATVKVILNQVNNYYLLMNKQNPDNKDLVFRYISEWISVKTGRSILAARVLASFFVQNCEVFDADSK